MAGYNNMSVHLKSKQRKEGFIEQLKFQILFTSWKV